MILKVIKGGRGPSLKNANATNHGTTVHYITTPEPNGFWSAPAACGAVPGPRGVGWLRSQADVNCTKCLKKIRFTT